LWGFNLSKKTDKGGNAIEVTEKMAPGFFSVPENFECDIRPRSSKHAEIMEREWQKADREGLDF
jgi:hypothetical protein